MTCKNEMVPIWHVQSTILCCGYCDFYLHRRCCLWLAGLAAAVEVEVIAVISYVLPAILLGLAINYGMKFVAKAVGAELAMIIGVVVAIAAISGVAGSNFNLFGEGLPTAQSLLQCSSALINAGNEIVYGQIMGVMEEIEQFSADAEKKMEVLDAVLLEK